MTYETYFNVHLVSDSTGETLNAVMRAACAQFDNIAPLEHNYYLVRSPKQLERVLKEIEAAPGVVLYTITDEALRTRLEERCREVGSPTLAVIDPAVNMLSRYLGLQSAHKVAGQYHLDAEYFARIETINFALQHDDGQHTDHLRASCLTHHPDRNRINPFAVQYSEQWFSVQASPGGEKRRIF